MLHTPIGVDGKLPQAFSTISAKLCVVIINSNEV